MVLRLDREATARRHLPRVLARERPLVLAVLRITPRLLLFLCLLPAVARTHHLQTADKQLFGQATILTSLMHSPLASHIRIPTAAHTSAGRERRDRRSRLPTDHRRAERVRVVSGWASGNRRSRHPLTYGGTSSTAIPRSDSLCTACWGCVVGRNACTLQPGIAQRCGRVVWEHANRVAQRPQLRTTALSPVVGTPARTLARSTRVQCTTYIIPIASPTPWAWALTTLAWSSAGGNT